MSVYATYTYTLINNGTAYEVVCNNISEATIAEIPSEYEGLPVTSIGSHALRNCPNLTSVVIPDSVTSIGSNAFDYCDSLTSVYITDIKAWCNISFGTPFSNPLYRAKNLYLNNQLVTELIIPDSVTSIGSYAFYSCDSLTSMVIGNGVASIGNDAFYFCDSLTSVVIGDSVTSIGDAAFSFCGRLTKIVIPDGVTSIGERAFAHCTSLTSVVIGDSVTSIGRYAFWYCDSLTEITLPFVGATKNSPINTHFGYIFGASSHTNNGNYVPTSLKKVTITGSSSIGKSAFSNCDSLTEIVIPDGVTSIDRNAFAYCDSLTSVTFKNPTPIIYSSSWFTGTPISAIYVPYDSVEAYKTAWTAIADKIYPDPDDIIITLGNLKLYNEQVKEHYIDPINAEINTLKSIKEVVSVDITTLIANQDVELMKSLSEKYFKGEISLICTIGDVTGTVSGGMYVKDSNYIYWSVVSIPNLTLSNGAIVNPEIGLYLLKLKDGVISYGSAECLLLTSGEVATYRSLTNGLTPAQITALNEFAKSLTIETTTTTEEA